MYKVIELEDNLTEYALDEVDCFQRPLGILIDSINKSVLTCFILYAKALEVYSIYNQREIRHSILRYVNKFGFEIRKADVTEYSFVENEIENNRLVVAGIEYRDLFYSSHYKEDSYPHWVIINGYDRNKQVFSIYDYTQFLDSQYTFKPFILEYRTMKRLNKKYKKHYGCYDSLYSINKSQYQKEKNNIVVNLLESILELMQNKNYSTLNILNEVLFLKSSNSFVDISIYQTFLMNIEKSRGIFFKNLAELMYEYKYKMVDAFIELSQNIENEYSNFVKLILVKLIKGTYQNIKFKDTINKYETELIEIISKFKLYMSEYSVTNKLEQIVEDKNIINDKDGVISIEDNRIIFDFVKNYEYNWWDYDKSPKYKISQIKNCKHLELKAKVNVEEYKKNYNFQVGFVVFDGKKYYVCVVDVHDKFCIDVIAKDNYSCYVPFNETFNIYVRIENGFIEFGTYNGEITKIYLKRKISDISDGYVGVVCKKWGKYGRLKVNFSDINVKR